MSACDPGPNVDRGWAIPLLFGAFLTMGLMFGVNYSSAIFYVVFLETFNRSASETALAVSVNSFTTYICQPVGSFVSVYLGATWTVALGCLLSSIGLISSTFTSNLQGIILTFGFVTGLGWSLCMIGTLHGIFIFFQRYRKLANSLTALGIAVGQFLYPPILELLLAFYNWQGCILILGALNLNILLVAVVMFAGRTRHLKTPEKESLMEDSNITAGANAKSRAPSMKTHLNNIKEMLQLALDRYCFLLNTGTLIASMAVAAFQTHITRAALVAGHSSFLSAMLPSAIGAAGIVGRIFWGLLVHLLPSLNIVWMTIGCYAGLMTVGVICVFWRSFAALLTSCIIFGFSIGIWTLNAELVAYVAGVERVVHALGLNGLFIGLGLFLGPPFLALLSETDPTYRLSFGVTSVCFLLGLLLLLPAAFRKKSTEIMLSFDDDVQG